MTEKNDLLANVLAFMRAADQTTLQYNVRQIALYTGLQLEELGEKLEAIGIPSRGAELKALGMRFKTGALDSFVETADRKALLDADIDLAWVTLGSAASQGANVAGACGEVSRANLAKILPSGKVLKDENGKVQKPKNWSAPDLSGFINTGIAV